MRSLCETCGRSALVDAESVDPEDSRGRFWLQMFERDHEVLRSPIFYRSVEWIRRHWHRPRPKIMHRNGLRLVMRLPARSPGRGRRQIREDEVLPRGSVIYWCRVAKRSR